MIVKIICGFIIKSMLRRLIKMFKEIKGFTSKLIKKFGLNYQYIILMEESAELIHSISKVIRFGLYATALNDKTNMQNLTHELADVYITMACIINELGINNEVEMQIKIKKKETIKKYKLRNIIIK